MENQPNVNPQNDDIVRANMTDNVYYEEANPQQESLELRNMTENPYYD